ncbi:MAG: phosphate ABC transporter substrate-binding protein [Thermoanaerobaculia bacterium]
MRIRKLKAALIGGLILALGAVLWGAESDVVVIVSRESAVTSLTRDQIADLFLGKLNRLPGGEKAVPLDQPEGSAVRNSFYSGFAGKTAAQVKAHWSKIIFTGRGQPPAQVPDGPTARRRVAEDPGAIAYIERALADETVRIVSDQ